MGRQNRVPGRTVGGRALQGTFTDTGRSARLSIRASLASRGAASCCWHGAYQLHAL
jgi:hypothetical protein